MYVVKFLRAYVSGGQAYLLDLALLNQSNCMRFSSCLLEIDYPQSYHRDGRQMAAVNM